VTPSKCVSMTRGGSAEEERQQFSCTCSNETDIVGRKSICLSFNNEDKVTSKYAYVLFWRESVLHQCVAHMGLLYKALVLKTKKLTQNVFSTFFFKTSSIDPLKTS
jgi:hypothetical protein